jgi:hypothetical protein
MTQHHISDAEYTAALIAGRTQPDTEILAQAVRYVPDRDAIEFVVNRNAGFLIPRQWIGAQTSHVAGNGRLLYFAVDHNYLPQ